VKFFKIEEFACKCCGQVAMKEDFLNKLDLARGLAGTPFSINSGYRCPEHNAAEKGDPDNHPRGWAADIDCFIGPLRLLIVKGLLDAGFTRIGISKDFIHVDRHPTKPKSIWLY